MRDFTEGHSKQLCDSPWLGKLHQKNGYLFKYRASEKDLSCCFLITDVENVWTEVMESKEIARRARQCNPNHGPSEPKADEQEEISWRRLQLAFLSNLHSPQVIQETEFSVEESSYSDLEISIRTPNFSWRWSVISAGRRSPQLLSKHLLLPLVTFASMSSAIEEPIKDSSLETLTKTVDAHARTTKISTGRQVVSIASKPMISTILLRATQIINGQKDLAQIESSIPPNLDVPSFYGRSDAPLSRTGLNTLSHKRSIESTKQLSVTRQKDHISSSEEGPGGLSPQATTASEPDDDMMRFNQPQKLPSGSSVDPPPITTMHSSPSRNNRRHKDSEQLVMADLDDEDVEQAQEAVRIAEIRRIKQGGENNVEAGTKSARVFKPPSKKRRL